MFCLGSGMRLRVVAERSCAREESVGASRGERASGCAILCRQKGCCVCCGGRASFLYARRSLRLVEGRSVLRPDWPPPHGLLDFYHISRASSKRPRTYEHVLFFSSGYYWALLDYRQLAVGGSCEKPIRFQAIRAAAWKH